MSHQIRTTPLAELQAEELDLWWRAHRPKSPDLFEQELAMAFRTISIAPGAGAPYPDPEVSGVRRVLLRSTRNHVYYLTGEDFVVVVAIWGAVKRSGPDLSLLTES